MIRTRFAPSPTGDLHLGGAWTALASWVVAHRSPGGELVLRVEDLDVARNVSGSTERIVEDLRWLGFDWQQGPVLQSERLALYEDAGRLLADKGLVYPCDCSRAEIARAASAPHAGEEGAEAVYPGFCRDRDPGRTMRRPPALRVRVPDETVAYVDGALGPISQNLAREVGDFVLRRGDGVFAYQLAATVDDVRGAITDVVRGADLSSSTPRQIWLASVLGASAPRYAHVAMVTLADGARLEKRARRVTVRELRDEGVSPGRIVGALAHGLGLAHSPAPATPAEVAAACASDPISWRTRPWPVPASL